MSSKHIARLRQIILKKGLIDEKLNCPDNDVEEPVSKNCFSRYVIDESSDESETEEPQNDQLRGKIVYENIVVSDGEEEDIECTTLENQFPKSKESTDISLKHTRDPSDENTMLAVASLNSDQADNSLCAKNDHNEFFSVDPTTLDVNVVLKKRFGGRAIKSNTRSNYYSNARKHDSSSLRRDLSSKRLNFGQPEDDWVKPPSFIAGGMSMRKIVRSEESIQHPSYQNNMDWGENCMYFTFIWSDDYVRLHQRYKTVSDSGDANLLVSFLSRYPYVVEGLLQLAMIFARTGQMDRAHNLVRRSLFCLESSFIDSFRYYEGNCRMDCYETNHRHETNRYAYDDKIRNNQVKEESYNTNIILLLTLFRHMQMCNMLGCPTVALNLSKIILSLDPDQDPMNILLHIDFLLLKSNEYPLLQKYFLEGPFVLRSHGVDSDTSRTVKGTNTETKSGSFSVHLPEDYVDQGVRDTLQIKDLLNWNFSFALSCFASDTTALTGASTGHLSENTRTVKENKATLALMAAIEKFPFVLNAFLDKTNVSAGGAGAWTETRSKEAFQMLKAHRYFSSIQSRCSAVHIEDSGLSAIRFEIAIVVMSSLPPNGPGCMVIQHECARRSRTGLNSACPRTDPPP